jgi:hypothetical protein
MNNIIIIKQYLLFNDKLNHKLINFIIKNRLMIYSNDNTLLDNTLLDNTLLDNTLLDNTLLDNTLLDNTLLDNKLEYIEWVYDTNNYRIPYINNKQIYYIKLQYNDDINDWISSTSLLYDNEIISGEKIQFLADIVCGTQSSIQWNPNNFIFSKIISSIDILNNIKNYKSIFVFTHDLDIFINKFNEEIYDKIIITHNSDHEISKIINTKIHFAQNCLIKNINLIPIPIGIENNQWFDNNLFHKVRKMNINKTKNIYFYFNLNTHNTRTNCYNTLNQFLEWNTRKPKLEYFIELAKHKYAVCPRGNGLDTHRIWECLYLNVIPIVLKNDFINIENLPIIIVNDWQEVINITTNIRFNNIKLSKLTIKYYNNLIKLKE